MEDIGKIFKLALLDFDWLGDASLESLPNLL